MAIVKVGASPLITKNKIGELTRRLSCYPHLNDAAAFGAKLQDYASRRAPDQPISPARRAHRLLEQGRIGAAGRALSHNPGIAPTTPETLDKLRQLHPHEAAHSWPIYNTTKISITPEVVSRVLHKVDPETAGGPSGLDGRTVHGLRFCRPFQAFLQDICQGMARGTLPLRGLFTGSRLIPLRKQTNGVRPLAVGELLYRLGMKIIARQAPPKLHPWQFGLRVRGGVEPPLHYLRHAARR